MDRTWALFGQAVHELLDRSEPSELTETRLYGRLGEYKISGQFDRLDLREGALQDYKVTSVWSVKDGVKEEWLTQLNVLRWLAMENLYTVEKLQIVAILRDWNRAQMLSNDWYPAVPVVVLDVPILENPEYYLLSIAQRHADAELELPECTEKERWYSGDKWAVMKNKNKRAVKLFDKPELAYEMAKKDPKNLWIQDRPGVNRRCQDYCPVAQFCTQYQSILNSEAA